MQSKRLFTSFHNWVKFLSIFITTVSHRFYGVDYQLGWTYAQTVENIYSKVKKHTLTVSANVQIETYSFNIFF